MGADAVVQQANIKRSSGHPAEEGEEGWKEPEGSGTPHEHKP